MRIAFTWDDGAPEDVKLMDLHNKYNIPGMFFVPTSNSEGRKTLSPTTMREQFSPIISFGGHTQDHVYLTDIPISDVKGEIIDNKHYLEDITGKPIDHFCLPGGKYKNEILNIVFESFKTVRTADTMNFKLTGNICKPTFHIYPRGIRSLVGNGIRNKSYSDVIHIMENHKISYFDMILSLLEMHKKDDSTIVIWGHSWEIEEFDLWSIVEKLFSVVEQYYKDCCVPYDELF